MYIVYIHIESGTTEKKKEDVYNTRCSLKFNDDDKRSGFGL